MLLTCVNFLFCLSLFFAQTLFAQDDAYFYKKAVQEIKAGQPGSAFSNLHVLLATNPDSKFSHDALLASGEYCFSIANFHGAQDYFERFLDKFPESNAKLFVLAYLLEIARRRSDAAFQKHYEKEIATYMQFSLLFREYKEYSFFSPLARNYKAVYFIDKVEFYIDEDLFTIVNY